MNKFKRKLTDVHISYEISHPYDYSIYDFIFDLNEHRKNMEKEGCYPESITISLECDKYPEDGENLFIGGYRPENEKELAKRLAKANKTKQHKNKMKEQEKQKRYKEYLELKKEFELDPMAKVELNDINK